MNWIAGVVAVAATDARLSGLVRRGHNPDERNDNNSFVSGASTATGVVNSTLPAEGDRADAGTYDGSGSSRSPIRPTRCGSAASGALAPERSWWRPALADVGRLRVDRQRLTSEVPTLSASPTGQPDRGGLLRNRTSRPGRFRTPGTRGPGPEATASLPATATGSTARDQCGRPVAASTCAASTACQPTSTSTAPTHPNRESLVGE